MRRLDTAVQLKFVWPAFEDYYLNLYRALEGKGEFVSKVQDYPEFAQPSPADEKNADAYHFKAAWVCLTELRPDQAAKHLEKLSDEARRDSNFSFLAETAFMATGDWEKLRELGEQQTKRCPEESRGWIIQGIGLEKMGKIQEAYSLLLGVLLNFSKDFFVHYNLACFACRLGRNDEAWSLLKKSFSMTAPETFERWTLSDDDLAPIRKLLVGLVRTKWN
jgi:tetratricopeptide (TPR) repeat protein